MRGLACWRGRGVGNRGRSWRAYGKSYFELGGMEGSLDLRGAMGALLAVEESLVGTVLLVLSFTFVMIQGCADWARLRLRRLVICHLGLERSSLGYYLGGKMGMGWT